MSQQGAALQNYNNELVKCFEDLCKRREDIQRQIHVDETEKAKLQRELNQITEKLNRVNDSLQKKLVLRNELDRTIAESEAAYMKILESSQTLLCVLKKEGQGIMQRAAAKNVPI
ncbi:Sjoegren syndrome nuclear autoantigen 1 -like protein [Echinococcus granulosus]|uniref:Sjoegren syndrome nuclear autoantigen n=1 Tax=Echinococcus granulosus TaxID=6210 RepID=W6UU17_ECHGR|nr:Sjoegren syndrome nuclear autoantigen [Echinococcus granulosus]EUB64803.1 Sjoegren syndrome nuclear autoantigen [Echinococcus granulosus]KAH9287065.1 Sjoegren syndrome nuclear autoantigen 1 -like protein [Echinococcus granulosus]